MAIVQISKIQQRSGNLVDLPQLDEAEFGWASDEKRLYIGKTTPNENIEVLTGYSEISFSQLDGSVGNLNINPLTVQDGEVLAFDGTNWVNRGGLAGGLINLGDVSNVRITGGAIGYVLETDGLGHLAWTPKSTITAYIENVTQASPGVVTTTEDNFFTTASEITITDVPGMIQLNGGSFYVDVLTANTFALYTDPGLTIPVDTQSGNGFSEFAYTSVTDTTVATNIITVGDSSLFSVNQPVRFLGDLETSGLLNDATYYVKTLPSSTELTVSNELLPNGSAGNAQVLSSTTGLTASMYVTGGRIISAIGGTSGTAAQGSNTTIQFNNNNILDGDADFTYNLSTKLMTLNGNANVGNLNATGIASASRFISNVATGTTPLQVTSTTRVANLNVAYSNVTDFVNVTTATTGTYYPILTNALTGNVAEFANSALSFNALTGNLTTTLLNVTANANIGGTLGVTGVATFSANANVSGNVNVTANLSVNNGAITNQLTVGANANITGNLNVTANSNVVGNLHLTGIAFLGANANITGNLNVTANANVVGNLHLTGIAFLGGNANITGNVNAGNVSATLLTGTLTTASQPNITSVGTLTTLGVNNTITAVAFTANTGVFTGNGSGLTALNASNISSGTLAQARLANSNVILGSTTLALGSTTTTVAGLTSVTSTTFVGALTGAATTAGTVTTNAQPNITSVGTLSSLTVSGNTTTGGIKTDNYYYANGASISFAGTYSNSNVASYLPTYTGTVGATALTTGANTTAGTITGNWTLTAGSRLEATYADLAEYYRADKQYEPGTVLEFGGEYEVTLADDETSRVAGVVTTNPAYVMNSNCPGEAVAIALQGRVPCKVRGTIRKGDMLVSGGGGYARPTFNPRLGTIIGKALEDYSGSEGIIEVAVGRL
jgi:hypothetical protein